MEGFFNNPWLLGGTSFLVSLAGDDRVAIFVIGSGKKKDKREYDNREKGRKLPDRSLNADLKGDFLSLNAGFHPYL